MMYSRGFAVIALLIGAFVAAACGVMSAGGPVAELQDAPRLSPEPAPEPLHAPPLPDVDPRQVLDTYCVGCHSDARMTGGLSLELADVSRPDANPELWERVIRKLRTRSMPPGGSRRPDDATYSAVAGWLEAEVDRAWSGHPNPGRINSIHRLNRTEYGNAIRDLFALDVDVATMLPGDETADGSFDNNADVLSITSAHMERYMSVARRVTRLATGFLPTATAGSETFYVSNHGPQDQQQSPDLPLGSRGGIAVRYDFPVDGEYTIRVRLKAHYADMLLGMGWRQQLDVLLDGRLVQRFAVGGEAPGSPAVSTFAGSGGTFPHPGWDEYMRGADQVLNVRIAVDAGPHVVGASFVRDVWEPEFVPQPPRRDVALDLDERYMEHASVDRIEIAGPHEIAATLPDTPSRREIFTCHPERGARTESCADEILTRMATRAYRRPVTEAELAELTRFFELGREEGGSFDAGVQLALERMLASPSFLLRIYRDPQDASPGESYALTDLEIASRLSFFLWGSIPDEQLLELAENGRLTDPRVLEEQTRRMLADPRAVETLARDFAGQWLNVRRVREFLPDPLAYPEFDDNLLEAMAQETELFVASTVEEDRSLLDLLRADYTFVNGRLARHYRIPGVYDSHFRRVQLPDLTQRGGLLGQAGLLAVSSYPDRTSPVLRGRWLLDNIVGAPPKPPPPGVNTTLEEAETPAARSASIRERLERHRTDRQCASCHSVIDPLGFALENFDAVGQWRTVDERGNPIDASGTMLSGAEIRGLSGLRAVLLEQPDQFPTTVTEKLMSYALARRLEYYDQPSVREIVRNAGSDDYSWSSIVVGIVQSPAFSTRTATVQTN